MNEPKTKLMVGVLGLLAVISVVSASAITKLSDNVNGNQVAQVSRTYNTTSSSITPTPTITRTSGTTTATAPIATTTTQTYKRGDSAPVIKEIQQILKDTGLYSGLVSGQIGPRTETAIKEFQTKNGLTPTGTLDTLTIGKIIKTGGKEGEKLCAPNSAPWIKVISPNGGEVYQAGQVFTPEWTTCNIPSENNVWVVLLDTVDQEEVNLGYGQVADGSVNLAFPNEVDWADGLKYKIAVRWEHNLNVNDQSDNLFTIQGGDEQITSECNAKVLYPHPGQTYTLEENANLSGTYIEVYGFMIVDNDTSDCVWGTEGSLIPTASNPPSGYGGILGVVEQGGGGAPLHITGNYNFANPTSGYRLYSQTRYFNPQTHPAGEYHVKFSDANNQHSITIPINIEY